MKHQKLPRRRAMPDDYLEQQFEACLGTYYDDPIPHLQKVALRDVFFAGVIVALCKEHPEDFIPEIEAFKADLARRFAEAN